MHKIWNPKYTHDQDLFPFIKAMYSYLTTSGKALLQLPCCMSGWWLRRSGTFYKDRKSKLHPTCGPCRGRRRKNCTQIDIFLLSMLQSLPNVKDKNCTFCMNMAVSVFVQLIVVHLMFCAIDGLFIWQIMDATDCSAVVWWRWESEI